MNQIWAQTEENMQKFLMLKDQVTKDKINA